MLFCKAKDMRFLIDSAWSFDPDVMLTCDFSNSNMYIWEGVFTWGCFPTNSALPLFHISLYRYHPSLYLLPWTNTSHQKWKLWWYMIAARSYFCLTRLRLSFLERPGWTGLPSSLSSSIAIRNGLFMSDEDWTSLPPQTELSLVLGTHFFASKERPAASVASQ